MSDRGRLVLRLIGYAAFFLVLFVYFLYLNFPYSSVKNRIIDQVQAGTRFRMEILSLAPDLFTGFKLRDVRIYHGDAVGSQLVAKLDTARIRIGLLSLIRGAVDVSLDVQLYEGSIRGSVRQGELVTDVDLTFEGLDVSQYDLSPFLGRFGEFNIQGLLGGFMQMHYDREDLQSATASAQLNIDGLRMVDSTVQGFEMPDIAFEPGVLKLELGSRALKIIEGDFTGDNMDVVLGGRMTVRDNMARSQFSYYLKFRPSGDLEDRFGELLQAFRRRDREGYYRINLTGSPSAPRFR